MGDFFQPGVVTTLHRLRKNSLDRRETELEFFSRHNPIALVLPSLYCELKEKALKTIVSEIQKMKYINQVIVTLGRAKEKEFEHAKEFFSVLPQETIVIWNDGERVRSLYEIPTENDLPMLLPVDNPIFLRDEDRLLPEALSSIRNLTVINGTGPRAWNKAILSIIG